MRKSLGAACAGAGELKQRLLELASLYGAVRKRELLLGYVCNGVIEHLLLKGLRYIAEIAVCADQNKNSVVMMIPAGADQIQPAHIAHSYIRNDHVIRISGQNARKGLLGRIHFLNSVKAMFLQL